MRVFLAWTFFGHVHWKFGFFVVVRRSVGTHNRAERDLQGITPLQPLPLEFITYKITYMRKAKAKKKTSIAWSKDEIELLKKLFPDGRAREIAERTERSLTLVRQKAYDMGIKTREYRHLWLADEVQLPKELYPNETAQAIGDKLGRSLKAVEFKASTIGLKKQDCHPWSCQETALLKKSYRDKRSQDIANELGRTVGAVVAKAHR